MAHVATRPGQVSGIHAASTIGLMRSSAVGHHIQCGDNRAITDSHPYARLGFETLRPAHMAVHAHVHDRFLVCVDAGANDLQPAVPFNEIIHDTDFTSMVIGKYATQPLQSGPTPRSGPKRGEIGGAAH
jgi:hypothetical protein